MLPANNLQKCFYNVIDRVLCWDIFLDFSVRGLALESSFPNSDIIRTFLEIIGWGDSGRILSGFCKDSKRILKGFCKDSGRLLEESGRILEGFWGFWKDSGTILEGFSTDSCGIPMILGGFWQNSGWKQ